MQGDIKQYEIVYLINGNDIYLQKNTKRCSTFEEFKYAKQWNKILWTKD